jgi:hypothetical protein
MRLLPPAALAALGIGLGVLLALVARAPLVHPDGPAYLDLAAALADGKLTHVLGGYYSPLYPAVVALLAATGVPLELAGRLAATLASLAALPLLYAAARRLVGPPAAAAAVLAAALQPALVKASAQVLPETLAGALLLGWLGALLAARGAAGFAGAGALAGMVYLARPEGILLLPLGLWRARRERGATLAAYAAAAVLIMSPALLAVHARSGQWQISPREARIAEDVGVPGARTLADAVRRAPGTMLGALASGAARQVAYDAKALGVLLVPFAVGLAAFPPRGAAAWPLAVAAWLTLLPLAINPSPRYAVPFVPFLLPWAGVGLLALGRRLGRHARPAAVALGVALVVQAVWISHPFDADCSREVSALLLERHGPGQAVVAVDGRFAYGARGRALVPTSTDPAAALELARRKGARLWVTRPRWIRPPWQPPRGVRAIARPCGGTFVVFELDPD